MEHKKIYLKIAQWVLVAAAYAYLIYRLLTFDDYATLMAHFQHAGWRQWVCLAVAVILFPLNILCEAQKWQYLLREIEPMTLWEAQRQTYFGFVGAFLTPGRLGDYPARVTLLRDKSQWVTAIGLGFIGTLALAFVQVLCGLPACIVLFSNIIDKVSYKIPLIVLCALVLLLQLLIIVFYPQMARWMLRHPLKQEKLNLMFGTLADFSHRRFLTTCLISLMRYAVYCLQLWCVMVFCGIDLTLYEALLAITAYYALVTITPSVPVADAAVRGSWSIVIFGAFTNNIAGVAIAAILLWMLNSILPMIVGSVVRKHE